MGRALIEGACQAANEAGRRLYDQVAGHAGFIVYARDVGEP